MSETGKGREQASRDADAAGLDLPALRARLAAARGREYWRSLEELAESPAFHRLLRQELPRHAAAWPGADGRDGPDEHDAALAPDAIDRRGFLHLMGASLALAGLSACTKQPPEQIAPYVRQPEGMVLG